MESRIGFIHAALVAGALAGVVTGIVIWLSGASGLLLVMGIPLVPELTPGGIYLRVAWGGMWGGVFALSWFRNKPHRRRGLVFGLLPSAAALLLFNPFKDGLGIFGLGMGPLWPAVVIVFNMFWGYTAGAWLDMLEGISRAMAGGEPDADAD